MHNIFAYVNEPYTSILYKYLYKYKVCALDNETVLAEFFFVLIKLSMK